MTAPTDEALDRRHPAEPGGRLQRRAPAPEGLRGAVPVPRRPAGLSGLGRVRRLGLQRPRAGARPPAARHHLRRAVAGSAGARLFAPVHHRLVPAQRDGADAARHDHHRWTTPRARCSWPARRWTPRGPCWTPPATRTGCRNPISTTPTTTSTRQDFAEGLAELHASATPACPRARPFINPNPNGTTRTAQADLVHPLPRPALLRQRVRRLQVEPERADKAPRRTSRSARRAGATAPTRPRWRTSTAASRPSATSCWTTRTCSATATRSSPTSTPKRTASTPSTGRPSSTSGACATSSAARRHRGGRPAFPGVAPTPSGPDLG